MVNAQEYLDKEYPLEERVEVKELNFSNQHLEDTLIIQDFPNLESIKCGNNKNLIIINLINLPKLNYFHANSCQISNISVINCPSITDFNIANNLLTDTNFLKNLNSEKLTHLSIHSNNFQEQNLSFLSKFINIEKLFVDNHDLKKLNQGIYNKFIDSLQSLQNLTNLKWLNIANTDISEGLEHLPNSVRKICLINSWERENTGYLDIKWELEKAVRLPRVTEKLQELEKEEPPFVKDWYRLAPWRQAKEIHGKDVFKKHKAQEWLDVEYPPHTNRKHYKETNINDKNLKGGLDLSDFTCLEKLNCSYNLLTNLDLSNCSNLIELNFSNNEFSNVVFLAQLPQPEKLEKLMFSNNCIQSTTLDFLTPFINLKELNISNCPFLGSLEPLKKMKNLQIINLINTDISSGLDYLSDNCRELHCDSNSKNKSKKLANILAKYLEERNNGEKYYNLVKWREKLRSNIILSIPTERLFVIRSNIKKFVDKWSKEVESNWYEKYLKKGQSTLKNRTIELSKLQSPEQFNKHWYWVIPQWSGRGLVGVGGALSFFFDYKVGVITIASPIIETITSYSKSHWYDAKEKKWEEFSQDVKELLDNYHELKSILDSLQGYRMGSVDKALKYLDNKSKEFLTNYDSDGNESVDIFELQEKKDILAQDLEKENIKKGNSQLGEIVQAITELEKEINKYRRGFYYGREERAEKESSHKKALSTHLPIENIVDSLGISEEINYDQQYHTAIELRQLIVNSN
ncbi:MAG: hypothetical protein mread185_000358 [Mycoplasmataceae bacterium]|nr:MAG: hypothetical protein mread185_000358 [Mycoplasmataceae bacterium]